MKVRTNIVLEIEGKKHRLYNENPSPYENCSLYLPCKKKRLYSNPCVSLGGNWCHFELK